MASQAIEVRYLPCTNTKPARWKATTCSGLSLTMSKRAAEEQAYGKGAYSDQTARVVAEALRDKLGWLGRMACGATARGYVFVFAD